LTTAEIALLLADGSDPIPDRVEAERMLLELAESGRVARSAAGGDAVWSSVLARAC